LPASPNLARGALIAVRDCARKWFTRPVLSNRILLFEGWAVRLRHQTALFLIYVMETGMSSQNRTRRLTSLDIRGRKGGEPIVALTAYTAPMAKIVDEVADVALVGDSLGMVVYGLDSTVPVTLEMMSLHGQAVMRATTRALVVIDMPFGSYEESPGAGVP
jgi:hypothetical protein